MRIAFDLDDTLIPSVAAFSTEPPPRWGIGPGEALRSGATALLRELADRGHAIGVYTTSDRARTSVWWTFLRYQISLCRIVNRRAHDDWLHSLSRADRDRMRQHIKYPPAFGFDLLVDDAIVVANAGVRHGFNVVLVDPRDEHWARRVLDFVRSR
jgi:hypothetical protein